MSRVALRDAGDVATRYGFRRVEHVQVVIRNGSAVATVTGICHRYPRTVVVPLRVAARLVAAGAPLRVEGTYTAPEAAGA
jgi:hypothetical protein